MNTTQSPIPNRLLRLQEVKAQTGLSRSTIYDMMKKNAFPATVLLGASSVAWVESEIQEWINERIAKRDEVA